MGGSQRIAQLTDIAGPRIIEQLPEGIFGDLNRFLVGILFLQQRADQFCFVAAIAKQRQVQGNPVQSVVKILAKFAVLNHLADVAMRGADHMQIDRNGLIASERNDFAFFDHTQQARLQHQRHIADFIEKQRAAVGLENLSHPAFLHRAGECAARVAEQLALDQALRDGGAIDRHECLVEPKAAVMQGLGEGFLAGAGRALQKYRHLLRE